MQVSSSHFPLFKGRHFYVWLFADKPLNLNRARGESCWMLPFCWGSHLDKEMEVSDQHNKHKF